MTASLSWTTNADLDLVLLNAAGVTVASNTGNAKPKPLSAGVPAAGTYTLRVIGAGGSPNQYPAAYTLTVTHP